MTSKRKRRNDSDAGNRREPQQVPPEKTKDQPETSTAPETDRREFLTRSTKVVAGLCGVAASAGIIRFAVPFSEAASRAKQPIGVLADFKMNSLTLLKPYRIFVTRDDTGVGAFSSECTHLGCSLRKIDGGFQCPCHGAQFDEVGAVVSGPARKSLPWYLVTLERDGYLWVDLNKPRDEAGTTSLWVDNSEGAE